MAGEILHTVCWASTEEEEGVWKGLLTALKKDGKISVDAALKVRKMKVYMSDCCEWVSEWVGTHVQLSVCVCVCMSTLCVCV